MSEAHQTLEGWYALHDVRRIDWASWKRLNDSERKAIADEASAFFSDCRAVKDADEGSSAVYAVLGHKGDLMLLHLRPTVDDLLRLEVAFAKTRLADMTERTYSYLSVTELSQYLSAGSEESSPQKQAFIERRLKPSLPESRYISFYPMNKRRGETENWYTLPLSERRELMQGHGRIGRAYKDQVQQMITGSMGFDDWEWGVTLFSDDPLPLKKIVQEMRFDEASSRFGLFGPFVLGVQILPEAFAAFMEGVL